MKHFSVLLTMPLHGFYLGELIVDAEDEIDAVRIISSMSKNELDKFAQWEHSDYYEGDVNKIDIDYDSIVELDREDD